MHITTKDHSGFLSAPMRMTLNDLECPIHLKVRFMDGTLDVRTLWLSDSAIRMGIARGGGGEGAGGSNPTLPPCGQLTRCLSAVAELLVCIVLISAIVEWSFNKYPLGKCTVLKCLRSWTFDCV